MYILSYLYILLVNYLGIDTNIFLNIFKHKVLSSRLGLTTHHYYYYYKTDEMYVKHQTSAYL